MSRKGFTPSHLERGFGVEFAEDGSYTVPYKTLTGDPYRCKEFSAEGKPLRWVGSSKRQLPYGLETIPTGRDTAFLTEGESCAWTLRASFPHAAVLGLPGASSWQAEWAQLLAPFPIVYLSFDNDPPGIELLDRVWPTIPRARRVKLPAGSDTRDVIQLEGEERYEALLDDADRIRLITDDLLARNQKDSLHVA